MPPADPANAAPATLSSSSRVARLVDATLLTAMLAAALVWPLRSPPVSRHGEAREGLVVQDIVRNGRWVLPRRNGELPSKPPLYHWIAASAASAFGSSDVTVRLPSALAAAAMLLATFWFALHTTGRTSAWLAAGALLGMYRFWISATEARVDMLFAACVAGTLIAFFAWYRRRGAPARAACYLIAAAAVLAKGPAGVALPAVVIVGFVLRERWRGAGARASLAALWSWRLVVLAGAIDVGWYALAYRAGGHEFLALQLVRENADRFLGHGVFGMHGGRSSLAMVHALATDLLPWNLVLAWAAVGWWRGAREDEAGRFLHLWWIAILAFFTLAYGKRSVYLLPLYPAVALLFGRAVAAELASGDRQRLFGRWHVPAAIRARFPAHPVLGAVAVAVVTFDVGLLAIGQLAREHGARRRSLVSFAREVAALVPPDAPLFAVPELSGSDLQLLAYRLARPVERRACGAPLCADGTASASATRAVYYLVPAAPAPPAGDATVLLTSRRRGPNVVLLRAPVAVTACVASDRGGTDGAPADGDGDDDGDDDGE